MRNRLLTLERKLYAPPAKPGKPRKRRGKRRPGPPRRGPRPIAARHRRRVRVRAQSFDWGDPIELTYNSESDSYVANAAYAAAYEDEGYDEDYEASAFDYDDDEGYGDDDYSEGYEASAFDYDDDEGYADDDYSEGYEASAFDYDDDEGYEDDDYSDSYEASAFDYDEEDDYGDDDYAEGYEASAFDYDEDDYDEAEAFEVESFDDEDDENSAHVGQAFSAVDLDEETLAEDLDFSDLDAALEQETPSKAMSDGDFAADLQAIITGQKTYDKDRGGMVSANPDDPQISTAAATDSTSSLPDDIRESVESPHDVFSQMAQHMPHNQMDSAALPLAKSKEDTSNDAQKPHDVFDRMGHNMSYANSFDLGSISLEQRFDEFDSMLDQEERAKSTAKSMLQGQDNRMKANDPPLALDEETLEADLAQMQALNKVEADAEKESDEQQEESQRFLENMDDDRAESNKNEQKEVHEERRDETDPVPD